MRTLSFREALQRGMSPKPESVVPSIFTNPLFPHSDRDARPDLREMRLERARAKRLRKASRLP